jgi:hypothetical protein
LERLSGWFRSNAFAESSPALASKIQALLPTAEACPLCRLNAQTERESVARVAGRLAEDPHGAIDSLSAICLPHLQRLVGALEDSEVVRHLMLREALILERIAEDMRRYATKYDAVRRILASDEETRAARTAISVLAGVRNVNTAGQNE